jgi:hypothetical protein
METPPDCRIYRAMFMARPSWLPLRDRVLVIVLSPALFPLALIRLLLFLLVNSIYLLVPRRTWRWMLRPAWVYRAILLTTVGIVLRTPGWSDRSPAGAHWVVMNHHGVQDVFLFDFMGRIGVTRLLVSYDPQFYARIRRWIFFFDHAFQVVSVKNRRAIVAARETGVTMVFPEGAGKKVPVVFSFQPAVFRIGQPIAPYAVSFRYAIPLVNAYGVDLPWHKVMAFLLFLVTPWTILTIRRKPIVAAESGGGGAAAALCRDMIADASGYQALDFHFDQAAFVQCVGSSHGAGGASTRRQTFQSDRREGV